MSDKPDSHPSAVDDESAVGRREATTGHSSPVSSHRSPDPSVLNPSTSIQAIVTDLGQVLLRFDNAPCWEKILARCEYPEARARFGELLVESRFGCGGMEAERFFQRAATAMGLRMSYPDFCAAWSDMFCEDAAVINLILGAPVQHRLVLSNTNAIHWDWIQQQYGAMLSRFDRCMVSHECGVEKPDPEIYRIAIRHTGLPAEAHLFIDDLVENVEGARAVGMDAVLHTDAESLREELRWRGLAPG
jgi:glucose-1-phosphatase